VPLFRAYNTDQKNLHAGMPTTRQTVAEANHSRYTPPIFGLASPTATRTPPPRLGVVLSAAEIGVKIEQVVTQSVAEATSLQVGDVIETTAGVSVRRPVDLIAIIQRQAPGYLAAALCT
jgi:S1-C subfamily serine protease